jgi:hypothetical protein
VKLKQVLPACHYQYCFFTNQTSIASSARQFWVTTHHQCFVASCKYDIWFFWPGWQTMYIVHCIHSNFEQCFHPFSWSWMWNLNKEKKHNQSSKVTSHSDLTQCMQSGYMILQTSSGSSFGSWRSWPARHLHPLHPQRLAGVAAVGPNMRPFHMAKTRRLNSNNSKFEL